MPEINEDRFVLTMIASWLTTELIKRGYPIRAGQDAMSLLFAVEQGEIIVVTRDINKIAILIHAIKSFVLQFAQHQNDIIQAAVKLANDLSEAAENSYAEITGESHLEILPN